MTKQEFILGYNKYHETLHHAHRSHTVASHQTGGPATANVYNHQTVADAQLVFSLADANGDGKLSSDELTTHLADLGATAQDIESLLFTLDTNGDNMVSNLSIHAHRGLFE